MKQYLAIFAILFCYGCANQKLSSYTHQEATALSPNLNIDKTPSLSNKPGVINQQKSTQSDVANTPRNIVINTRPITTKKKPVKFTAKTKKPHLIKKTRQSAVKSTIPTLSPSTKKSEPVVVAVLQKSDELIKPNNISFALDKLPLNFGKTWFLDKKADSASKTTRCLIFSADQEFNDGYGDARISIQISSDSVLLKTNSTIDMSYSGIGLYIDQNAPLPLGQLFGDSNILIKKNTKEIIRQLQQGKNLTIKLGFWPTWPKLETREINFNLFHFNKAYQALLACKKL